jgi:hypothetical protein
MRKLWEKRSFVTLGSLFVLGGFLYLAAPSFSLTLFQGGGAVLNCFKDDAVLSSGEIYSLRNGNWSQSVPDGFYPENVDIAKSGRLIAYSKGTSTQSEIYVKDLDTGLETQITNNAFFDSNPNISPDESEVIYFSLRGTSTQLYISNIDGTNERRIINNPSFWTYDPEWSNNNRDLIAFNVATSSACKAEVYVGVLNPTHTELESMFSVTNTNYQYAEVDPAWNWNGQKLAISSYDGPGCWYQEGLEPSNTRYWKIKTVDVDLSHQEGRGSDDYVLWLPIWKKWKRWQFLYLIRSTLDGPPEYPFGTNSRLVLYSVRPFNGIQIPVPGSNNCYWHDMR